MIKTNFSQSAFIALVLAGVVGLCAYISSSDGNTLTIVGVISAVAAGAFSYITSDAWKNTLPPYVDTTFGVPIKPGYGKTVKLETGDQIQPVIINETPTQVVKADTANEMVVIKEQEPDTNSGVK